MVAPVLEGCTAHLNHLVISMETRWISERSYILRHCNSRLVVALEYLKEVSLLEKLAQGNFDGKHRRLVAHVLAFDNFYEYGT